MKSRYKMVQGNSRLRYKERHKKEILMGTLCQTVFYKVLSLFVVQIDDELNVRKEKSSKVGGQGHYCSPPPPTPQITRPEQREGEQDEKKRRAEASQRQHRSPNNLGFNLHQKQKQENFCFNTRYVCSIYSFFFSLFQLELSQSMKAALIRSWAAAKKSRTAI